MLKNEIKKLELELFDSYDIIDELEFEVEQVKINHTKLLCNYRILITFLCNYLQIAYLESENERLGEELRIVRLADDETRSKATGIKGEHYRDEWLVADDGAHKSGRLRDGGLVHCQPALHADGEDGTAMPTTCEDGDVEPHEQVHMMLICLRRRFSVYFVCGNSDGSRIIKTGCLALSTHCQCHVDRIAWKCTGFFPDLSHQNTLFNNGNCFGNSCGSFPTIEIN